MKIIKKINTSAVIALDSRGNEIIALGKGIGFPPVPYELEDLSKIERTFYDVAPQYREMIASLPKDILLASTEIAERAEVVLGCELNANLAFSLADHLHFSWKRLRNGINLTTPIAYDIKHLYPKEYAMGQEALEILQEIAGITLPDHEGVSIAMHLINAEAESTNIHDLMRTMQIIDEIVRIVEKNLKVKVDHESYAFSRFVLHLRFLLQRLQADPNPEKLSSAMLKTLAREYPEMYMAALKVGDYLKGTWGWSLTEDEQAYLLLHIHRAVQMH